MPLKDGATQLLIKCKSGALVTQWSIANIYYQNYHFSLSIKPPPKNDILLQRNSEKLPKLPPGTWGEGVILAMPKRMGVFSGFPFLWLQEKAGQSYYATCPQKHHPPLLCKFEAIIDGDKSFVNDHLWLLPIRKYPRSAIGSMPIRDWAGCYVNNLDSTITSVDACWAVGLDASR